MQRQPCTARYGWDVPLLPADLSSVRQQTLLDWLSCPVIVRSCGGFSRSTSLALLCLGALHVTHGNQIDIADGSRLMLSRAAGCVRFWPLSVSWEPCASLRHMTKHEEKMLTSKTSKCKISHCQKLPVLLFCSSHWIYFWFCVFYSLDLSKFLNSRSPPYAIPTSNPHISFCFVVKPESIVRL